MNIFLMVTFKKYYEQFFELLLFTNIRCSTFFSESELNVHRHVLVYLFSHFITYVVHIKIFKTSYIDLRESICERRGTTATSTVCRRHWQASCASLTERRPGRLPLPPAVSCATVCLATLIHLTPSSSPAPASPSSATAQPKSPSMHVSLNPRTSCPISNNYFLDFPSFLDGAGPYASRAHNLAPPVIAIGREECVPIWTRGDAKTTGLSTPGLGA